MSTPAADALDGSAGDPDAGALGVVLMTLGALALVVGPFVTLKPNRIAEGEPLMAWGALAPMAAVALIGFLLAGAVALAMKPPTALRWIAPAAGLAGLLVAVAMAASRLVPPADRLARVSPDWGFWAGTIAVALALTDAAARLKPSPAARAAATVAAGCAAAAVLHGGLLDGLSVMREYAVRRDTFTHELIRHLELALGSAAAAILLGLPLGLLLHARERARGIVLSGLTAIQAIPSIALFGLLMAPLAWLAHAIPVLGTAGIRGIGAAPAFIALTLYALLPIVASTVSGLAAVPPDAVDAAKGAGMTRTQTLLRVECPLALAAVLSGVRVVLVQTIGLTTVAALIGGGGLGTFVFQGLGQTAIDLVLLGTVPIVAMAVAAGILLDAGSEAMRWTA